jgi:acetyltransferase-like isoleucine patch superfamily enzyme
MRMTNYISIVSGVAVFTLLVRLVGKGVIVGDNAVMTKGVIVGD